MIEMTNAQIRRLEEIIKGYRETIKNTIEKTRPKDFSVGLISEDLSIVF
tara:strand:+ start:321 stop:467 length:147 start_codon:yes stop_codon:yes gene_type:complete